MPVTINRPEKQRQKGHSSVLKTPDLNTPGLLFKGHLLGILNVSDTTLKTHIKRTLVPPPDGHLGKRPFWRKSTILNFINR